MNFLDLARLCLQAFWSPERQWGWSWVWALWINKPPPKKNREKQVIFVPADFWWSETAAGRIWGCTSKAIYSAWLDHNSEFCISQNNTWMGNVLSGKQEFIMSRLFHYTIYVFGQYQYHIAILVWQLYIEWYYCMLHKNLCSYGLIYSISQIPLRSAVVLMLWMQALQTLMLAAPKGDWES